MRVLSWNLWWRYGPWERRREAIAHGPLGHAELGALQ